MMLDIIPLPNVIYLKTETAKAGALDTSSRDTAVEFAEVIAVGHHWWKLSRPVKVGDKIFVKSWAIDLINYKGEWYKFVHTDTNGILAIVKE